MASPVLRLRVSREQLAGLDARASALGVTRSDMARALIAAGLSRYGALVAAIPGAGTALGKPPGTPGAVAGRYGAARAPSDTPTRPRP